jgi:ferredoxin-type protein NapH
MAYFLLGLSFFGIAVVLIAQSPYASFMGIVDWNMSYITNTAWILLGILLGLSLFIDRPFCRYLCPEGARYGIISLARIFTITRDEEKCVSCKKCDKVCPSQIEVSQHPEVRNAQCVIGWAFKK